MNYSEPLLIEKDSAPVEIRHPHFAPDARSQAGSTLETSRNEPFRLDKTSNGPKLAPHATYQTKGEVRGEFTVGFLRHGEGVRLCSRKEDPGEPWGHQGPERHRRALGLVIPCWFAPQHGPTPFHQAPVKITYVWHAGSKSTKAPTGPADSKSTKAPTGRRQGTCCITLCRSGKDGIIVTEIDPSLSTCRF
jgi:hypothetical protein